MAEGTAVAPISEDKPIRAIVLVCLGLFVLTCQDALVKWLSERYPLMQIIFIRGLIMLPLLLLYIRMTDGMKALRTRRPLAQLLRAFLHFSTFMCFYFAISRMPLADVLAIVFSAPLFITLLSGPLLGEKVGWRRGVAVFVGFIGVVIMVRPGASSETDFWVAMVALLSSLLYSLWMLHTRVMTKSESNSGMIFYSALFFSTASAPFVFGEGQWIAPPPGDLLIFLGLALNATLGLFLITQAYRLAPPAVVAPFDYTSMIWAVALGWMIWGDLPGWSIYAGSVLVIGCGLYILRREVMLAKEASAAKAEPAPH